MLGVDLDGSPFAAEREAGRTFATERAAGRTLVGRRRDSGGMIRDGRRPGAGPKALGYQIGR
jgi:hypothetical protein